MSSAISFSGFNNIDFGSIVNALMQQASAPLTALQSSQTALQSQITSFSTLGARTAALSSASEDLASLTTVSAFSGTSSDASSVAVSTSSTAREGHYDVVVTDLARAQVTVSTSSAADSNTTIVASAGTLSIGGVDVTIGAGVTMQGLADAINGTDGIGVTATVIRTGTNTYRLALTSTDTGEDYGFTVTNGLTGSVTFGGNAVEASDASLLVNNIPVTSSSNTIEDIVPGVALTVLKKDPDATIRIDVAPDSSELKAKVEAFITAYNSLAKFADDQRVSAAKGDTSSIGRNPLLGQLRTALRSALLGGHGAGAVSRLAEAGIEFTRTGTLELNETMFDEAVTNHAADLQEMFAGTDGAFPAVATLLDSYSASTGFISTVKDQLAAQVSRMDAQIIDMQSRLAAQRLALQQEFAAADAAISRLNSQKDSLSNFGSNLGSSL